MYGIASTISEEMEKDLLYVMGPGTTTASIMEYLGLENTLLGIDAIRNRESVSNDVGERELMDLVTNYATKVVVSVIGGQGYILGRGNQQLSPQVVSKVGRDNFMVVASKGKLASLGGRPLLVDTGDDALDDSLSGYWKVLTGYREYVMYIAGQ